MPQDKVLMGSRGILVQYWHTDTLGTVTILTGLYVCSQWQQKAILRHKTNLSTSHSKQQQKNGLKIQVKLQNYTRLCHAHYDYNLIIFYDIKETVRDKRCKLSSVRGGGNTRNCRCKNFKQKHCWRNSVDRFEDGSWPETASFHSLYRCCLTHWVPPALCFTSEGNVGQRQSQNQRLVFQEGNMQCLEPFSTDLHWSYNWYSVDYEQPNVWGIRDKGG